MSERRKFTVRRETWLRGVDPRYDLNICLLRKDGRQCCLGFVAEQRGVPREHLLDVLEPEDLPGHALIEGLLVSGDCDGSRNSALSSNAMVINDDHTIDDAERERLLTALFAEHGCALEFV